MVSNNNKSRISRRPPINELIVLEILRHFKEGQLATWVGDEWLAVLELVKCRKAVAHLRTVENNKTPFDDIDESAKKQIEVIRIVTELNSKSQDLSSENQPSSVDVSNANLFDEDIFLQLDKDEGNLDDDDLDDILPFLPFSFRGYGIRSLINGVLFRYTILPIGSSRSEFRGRIYWSSRKMYQIAHKLNELDSKRYNFNGRTLQWIIFSQENQFAGSVIWNVNDGVLYSQVTTFFFTQQEDLLNLAENFASEVAEQIKSFILV